MGKERAQVILEMSYCNAKAHVASGMCSTRVKVPSPVSNHQRDSFFAENSLDKFPNPRVLNVIETSSEQSEEQSWPAQLPSQTELYHYKSPFTTHSHSDDWSHEVGIYWVWRPANPKKELLHFIGSVGSCSLNSWLFAFPLRKWWNYCDWCQSRLTQQFQYCAFCS